MLEKGRAVVCQLMRPLYLHFNSQLTLERGWEDKIMVACKFICLIECVFCDGTLSEEGDITGLIC